MKLNKMIIPVIMSLSVLSGCNTKHDVLVETITLNETTLSLDVNETFQLTSEISPITATNTNVVWTVEANNIATVVNGLVTGVSYGSTKVICSSVDGNAVAECNVTVLDKNPAINVTLTSEIDGVNVTPDKQVAKPGEVIQVTVSKIRDGYKLENLSLKGSDGASIEMAPVPGDQNYAFSYIQPRDGIARLTGKVNGKTIKAYIHDEHEVIENVAISTDGVNYTTITDGGNENGVKYLNLIYGAKARVELKTNGYYVPNGINLDGDFMAMDENNQIYFDLVLEDLDNFFFSIEAVSTNTEPLSGSVGFSATVPSSIRVTFFNQDKSRILNGANPNDIVYIHMESNDESITVGQITATYSASGSSKNITVERIDDEWASFKVPETIDEGIEFSFQEVDKNLITRHGLKAGKYLNVYVSAATNVAISNFVDENLNLAGNGYMSIVSSVGGKTYESYASSIDNEYITVPGTINNKIPYGDGCLVVSRDTTKNAIAGATFTTLDVFCVPMVDDGDLISQYSVYGEELKLNGNNYAIVRVYRNNTPYKTAFFDFANRKVHFGVEINMISGNDINDNLAFYEINENETNLATIGYNTNGGVSDRVLMGEYKGIYTNEEDTLFIHGATRASYNQEECSLMIDGNGVATLLGSTHKYVVTLNNETKTFTVNSVSELSADLPIIAGMAFRAYNVISSGTYEPDYGIYVKFSETAYTFSIIVGSGNDLSLENSRNAKLIQLDVNYEFGVKSKFGANGMIMDFNGNPKEIVFNYVNARKAVLIPDSCAKELFPNYINSPKGITLNLIEE